MQHIEDLLSAMNREAITRMSPYELADRATALRIELGYNALQLEPIDVDGGRLYTVSSGIVAGSPLETSTTVESDEIVRKQVAPEPLTVFADVVELRPPAKNSQGEARLYRTEQPLLAVLDEARAPFRDTILQALKPVGQRLSHIRLGSTGRYYDASQADTDGEAITLASRDNMGRLALLATPESQIHVDRLGVNQLDKEVGVHVSLSGQVRAKLEPYYIARITAGQILAGPAEQMTVQFNMPENAPQSGPADPHDMIRIPDDAEVVRSPDTEGELVLTGDRACSERYKYTRPVPSVDSRGAVTLLPVSELGLTDVTNAFLHSLAAIIANIVPLHTTNNYAQTYHLARRQVRETLLAGRTPVMGGNSSLAVAARLAELPATMPGLPVDEAFFRHGV